MNNTENDRIYELIEQADYEAAQNILFEILSKDESDMEAKKLLALCKVNNQEYDSARQILEDLIKYFSEDALCWYYLGCCYDSLDMFAEAISAYEKVIELRPEYIDAYKSLSIIYLRSGKPEKTCEIVVKAMDMDKEDYSFPFIMGTACMAAGNFQDSIKYLNIALELNPNNIQIYNNLGTSYLTIGDYDNACAAYQKAINAAPEDSLAYFNLASILQIQNKHAEACEYFEKAHNLDPNDDSYIIAWAVSEVKVGKISDAIEHYKHLAINYPQKTSFKYNLATCYQALGEFEIAISLLNQLAILNPKATHILKKLSSIYMVIGEYSKAKEIYDRMIRQGTTSFNIYYEYAILCVKAGDIDNAEQALKKVCKLQPEFAPAHKDLGVIYLNKRLFDYAKDEFELAYKYDPENESIVLECANYYHSVSNFEKADEFYQKALELCPHDSNALAFSALNKTHLKQIDEAKEQIKHALEHNASSSFLLFIAGRIYFLDKDFQMAKEYLIKSYELEQIPDVQNLLALCYFELEDYKQAKAIFKNLVEKSPMNLNVLLNLAKCCEKLGESEEALKYANTITETFPECEEAQELIRNLS